jgi:hypothetical protein
LELHTEPSLIICIFSARVRFKDFGIKRLLFIIYSSLVEFLPNKSNKIELIMSTTHREAIQKQIQQDWANREYIEVITGSIKKITDFLNNFG